MGLMAHLAVFLKIFSIPFGIIAMIILFQHHHKYHYQYLRIYGYIVTIVVFNAVLTMGLFYIHTNLYPRFLSSTALVGETIYCFLTSLTRLVLCYLYALLYRDFMQKREPNKYRNLFLMFGGLLLAVLIFFSFYSIQTSNVLPISNVSVTLILLCNLFNIGVLLILHKNIARINDKGKQTAVRRFTRVMLIPYLLAMLVFILHLFYIFSNEVFVVFFFIFEVVLFGFPIFYLKRFMELYHGVIELTEPDMEKQFAKLLNKYNISKREREVLELICEGKTNKQIEKILFISLQTVKDHVSRIYQKTGVKNRVQLNNLFRFSGVQSFSVKRKGRSTPERGYP
jgi:DNA-binding CsgD family transcriptional regulator/uncharacterized membrane protein